MGLTGHHITRIHGVFVLKEAKAIHQFDLGDLARMGGKVRLNVRLGNCGYDRLASSVETRQNPSQQEDTSGQCSRRNPGRNSRRTIFGEIAQVQARGRDIAHLGTGRPLGVHLEAPAETTEDEAGWEFAESWQERS